MGVVNANASPFLPVLIARLGGTAFTISLLTSILAVAGFTLAIPIGQFLQRRGNPVKWYSTARLISNSLYALIGLTVALAPHQAVIPIIVAIWALAAIPSTMGAAPFPIVMDGAAGPHGRLELMSRRWSWMGLTMAITVIDRRRVPGARPPAQELRHRVHVVQRRWRRQLLLLTPIPDPASRSAAARHGRPVLAPSGSTAVVP